MYKLENIQAENKDGNFIDYFDKKDVWVYHPKRVLYFYNSHKRIMKILDDFDKLSEQEIKNNLKNEHAKAKLLPKTHQDRTIKVFLYFNGNVENVTLYITDIEIPIFQSEKANTFIKKYNKYINDYIEASSNNNFAQIDRVSRMTPQITREANEVSKEIFGLELYKFNEFMTKKSDELQKYFDSKK